MLERRIHQVRASGHGAAQQRLLDLVHGLDYGRLALSYNHSKETADTERRLSLHDEIDVEDWDEAVDGPVTFEPVGGRDPDERKAFWETPRALLTAVFSEDDGQS